MNKEFTILEGYHPIAVYQTVKFKLKMKSLSLGDAMLKSCDYSKLVKSLSVGDTMLKSW